MKRPTPYFTAPGVEVFQGDCRTVLAQLPEHSIDAVVCDPPYDLTAASRKGSPRTPGTGPAGRHRIGERSGGFMNKSWDGTGVAFDPATWAAVLRVLKPGGFLASFGGTRTSHRMVCAIEDAGFEIRDSVGLVWYYGVGFPKSTNISLAIDKAAGAGRGERRRIKPGHESFVGRPRPRIGGMGTGKILTQQGGFKRPWMDDPAKVEAFHYETEPVTEDAKRWDGWGSALRPAHEPICLARAPLSEKTLAANVLKWGVGGLNIRAGRLGKGADDRHAYGVDGDEASTPHKNTYNRNIGRTAYVEDPGGRWPPNVAIIHDPRCHERGTTTAKSGTAVQRNRDGKSHNKIYGPRAMRPLADASYAASDGAETVTQWDCVPSCPVRLLNTQAGERVDRFMYTAKASSADRPGDLRHPTVKPLALMSWICRLVTPPGGTILDPFAGSGTTLSAARALELRAIGIEQDEGSCKEIVARLGARFF